MGDITPLDVDSGIDAAWGSVPHPVLVVDRDGMVRTLSTSARSVLPDVRPGSALEEFVPSWLSGARHREATPTPLPDGEVAWWLTDGSDRTVRDTQQALNLERERAAFLDEASAMLMASLNIDRCMEATVQLAARHLADAAVLVAPMTAGSIPVVCSGPDGSAEHRTVDAEPVEVAGLSEALRGFPPVPSRWIDPASVPDWLVPVGFTGQVGSVVITPLPGHGVPAGALVLLRRNSQTAFSEGEEIFARLFAARAGAALSAARLYAEQSAITRTLMRDLLPPQLHRLDGIELAGGYRASEDHEAIGGDFYDVHPPVKPGDETLVVLGDVCGKGLEAAVLTGKIRNTLQALAPLADDHLRVLKLLNSALLSVDDTRFATLVLVSVTRRDGQVELRLTSAGHLAPLIVRNDGRVEEVDTRGTLIGVMPQIRARTVQTVLAPGETCLLFTDGVTEARGGPLGTDLFGEQRLAAALAECAGLPAEAVVERIMMLTTQWVNEQAHDDIAVVAITAPRRTHLSAVDGHTAGRYTA
ncbi:serine phosphatase RsbU (regulator of sigma subunit) [Mycolicibacterium iranicum]|uniref:Serine phosphatase RsbU (Regulator of sigma subunit) n=1 Tax=Mycolicibacterium iranicum TaxID=912594 RepID=A0A839Q0C5_MYCIR|nr:PP2C family protein-serine/threonine phosphatase [Mycolicibacterium iranicum]MBB2989197.1 serine phosphatase RsbU (regulator of sigma subunit) [Mycolicibacterium iranicum]